MNETFIFERAIDRATYESQKHKLEKELTLVEMELREAKADECDVEGVLTFAEHVVLNAARLWTEFSLKQKQRFSAGAFPGRREFRRGKISNRCYMHCFQRIGGLGREKIMFGDPTGNRTRAPSVKGRCPNR